MQKKVIESKHAPRAIGTYSQAISVNGFLFLSGQIPLDPSKLELVSGDISIQAEQVFCNLKAVLESSGANLKNIVKLTVYLTDLIHFDKINEAMAKFFPKPYPARAVVQVAALPKGAAIEVDAIAVL